MKKILPFLVFIPLLFCSCTKQSNNSINVYCYDSFVGDYGPGKEIAENFEKETGIHVNLISCAGSIQLYTRILYEGDKCNADAVIGLPDSISINKNLFLNWLPNCKNDLISYENNELIPFNYGIFAFVCNTHDQSIRLPESLRDLANDQYKNKFIIIDPRTSSVGLGLLKWSYYALGDAYNSWWTKVLNNALTIADSWSSAYGLFTEGEASLVISYTTSPIYHLYYENNNQYQALSFKEGHITTTEYLAILKNSKHQEQAKMFCEYVLTKGQSLIALSNTMYPANNSTELPEAYNSIGNFETIKTKNDDFISQIDNIINNWTELAVK